jgi:hypothetical protein
MVQVPEKKSVHSAAQRSIVTTSGLFTRNSGPSHRAFRGLREKAKGCNGNALQSRLCRMFTVARQIDETAKTGHRS